MDIPNVLLPATISEPEPLPFRHRGLGREGMHFIKAKSRPEMKSREAPRRRPHSNNAPRLNPLDMLLQDLLDRQEILSSLG